MLPPIPPTVCRDCRIGHHRGCTDPGCSCDHRSHAPADLIDVDEGDGFPAIDDPAADLECAKACLYALEERATRAIASGSFCEVGHLLKEIRDISRVCLIAIDQD